MKINVINLFGTFVHVGVVAFIEARSNTENRFEGISKQMEMLGATVSHNLCCKYKLQQPLIHVYLVSAACSQVDSSSQSAAVSQSVSHSVSQLAAVSQSVSQSLLDNQQQPATSTVSSPLTL